MQARDLELIVNDLATFEFDPVGFVLWAFPWGEKGSQLEAEEGPEQWQIDHLNRIGEKLEAGGDFGAIIEEDTPAGHGVGKSAVVSWVILWAISTHENTRGVVTANTDTQLRTKTWAELAKWHSMFIARDLFTLTATAIYAASAEESKMWRIDMIPWSKERSEAFAGLHNKGNRILVLFDEASAIDDLIWEVTEGALTDEKTQIVWCRYGNPTRTSGRFHKNCMQPKRNTVTRVDARNVRFTNKSQIAAWIEDYGEDSDFVRVRVKGQFPRAGTKNFISPEVVEQCRYRQTPDSQVAMYQMILSIDPARFGDDKSVISLRQGLKLRWQRKFSGYDGPDLTGKVMEICREFPGITVIAYDAIGVGADLDSSLRRAVGLPQLLPVTWGNPASDTKQFFNMRAECWSAMRDWLKTGDIPNDDELCNELTSVDYGYDALFRIQLQSKKDIKKNGGKSPDCADSLALSFAADLLTVRTNSVKAKPVIPKSAGGWT